jgi:hypothetical protein
MANIDSSSLSSVQISSIRSPKAEELRDLLDKAYDLTQQIKDLESKKKEALKSADILRRKMKLPGKIESDLWTTIHIIAARETIKKEKLLEHGVPMDVIDECTVVSPYESFYVQGKKQTK